MFGSAVLEVGIGLTFFYLLLSVMCSAINEWISGILALRGKNLRKGIENLLHDSDASGVSQQLLSHPLIKSLGKPSRRYTLSGVQQQRLPSYIPPAIFTSVLMDLLAEQGGKQDKVVKDVHGLIENIGDQGLLSPDLKKTLMVFVREAGNDMDQIRSRIETWYGDGMDRVSGWYKRQAQMIIFLIGVSVTVAVNADTITIASTLWNDSALRTKITMLADSAAKVSSKSPLDKPDQARNEKDGTQPVSGVGFSVIGGRQTSAKEIQDTAVKLKQFPLGWSSGPKSEKNPLGIPNGLDWLTKIVGLMVTVFSVSLGAPFWFDLMSKLVKVRSSVQTASKSFGGPR